MTLVLIGKDLVLQGLSTKTEDIHQVPGRSVAKLSWQSFAKETIPRVGELNSRAAIEKEMIFYFQGDCDRARLKDNDYSHV